jgi:hypothetical protein
VTSAGDIAPARMRHLSDKLFCKVITPLVTPSGSAAVAIMLFAITIIFSCREADDKVVMLRNNLCALSHSCVILGLWEVTPGIHLNNKLSSTL